MMTLSAGVNHVWLAIAATGSLLACKRREKIAEVVQTNHEGTHRSGDRQTATPATTTAHTRPGNTVLSHPRKPPRLPRLLRRSAPGQPTIRSLTPTRANQIPFAPTTDSATAVRRTRSVRQRHRRWHLLWFRKMLGCLSFTLHVPRHKLFLVRAHALLRRLLTIFTG